MSSSLSTTEKLILHQIFILLAAGKPLASKSYSVLNL